MIGGYDNVDDVTPTDNADGPVNFNNIFMLDMDSMEFKSIKGSPHLVNAGLWPKERISEHTLTMISQKAAVLFGGRDSDEERLGDCWLLNIDECITNLNAEKIWIQCKHHEENIWFGRCGHAAVKEPSSHRVWIVGGFGYVPTSEMSSLHIKELTFSSDQTLKVLALESVTKNLDKLSPQIKELPETLRLSVEAKSQKKYIIT